jgi:hypothetical protein
MGDGPRSVTVWEAFVTPSRFTVTDTVPAYTPYAPLDNSNKNIVSSFVQSSQNGLAKPVPESIVIFVQEMEPGLSLKVNSMWVVTGLPTGIAVQVIPLSDATSVTV